MSFDAITQLKLQALERQAEELIEQYQADAERINAEADAEEKRLAAQQTEATARSQRRAARGPIEEEIARYRERFEGVDPDAALPTPAPAKEEKRGPLSAIELEIRRHLGENS